MHAAMCCGESAAEGSFFREEYGKTLACGLFPSASGLGWAGLGIMGVGSWRCAPPWEFNEAAGPSCSPTWTNAFVQHDPTHVARPDPTEVCSLRRSSAFLCVQRLREGPNETLVQENFIICFNCLSILACSTGFRCIHLL